MGKRGENQVMELPQPPLPTRRAELLARLAAHPQFDVAVVGGGATGLGVALDAASRGLRVVLVEAQDFAKGTSSRSTKLVHGGVRYLAQGNISLVKLCMSAPCCCAMRPISPSRWPSSYPATAGGSLLFMVLA